MVKLSWAVVAAAVLPVVSAKCTPKPVKIKVESHGGNATSTHQYGFLHEDISNSGDGGLYAELIRNRAFQNIEFHPASLDAWSPVNGASLSLNVLDQLLSSALQYSMNVAADSSAGQVGFSNDGYWGMNVKKQTYTGSFWVKGDYEGSFTASLQSNLTGEVFGSTEVESKATSSEWTEHTYQLVPTKDAPNANNTFILTFDAAGAKAGSLDFNLISLFPPTYRGRKNGLRIDLAEAIESFHPTLLRIPGGNMLEGLTNTTRWDWKETLGPLKDRPGYPNVWGYPQTNGLGLMEYLELSEDMNLEIVLAVYSGLALNGDIVPKEKLQPFIDDALDEVEFISGAADTKWGSVRAALGHPAPFKLQFVQVGNEDWLAGGEVGWQTYQDYRFPMFFEAIRVRYPHIHVLSSGSVFDGHNIPAPGLGDYHVYATPNSLVDQFDLFDQTPVTHIIGEAAAVHPNGGAGWDGPELMAYPFWIGTVGEAVSMIGYERNTDRIIGSCYAPILRSLDRWQWAVTMIHFAADPAKTTKSTSWYTWELFAGHLMTHTLPASASYDPLYYVTGKNQDKGTFIFKGAVYNSTAGADVPVSLKFDGVKAGTQAELTLLTGPADPYGYNDPFTGVNVVKTTKQHLAAGKDGSFKFSMPNLSVAVLETEPSEKKPKN
ncbi:glycoside hydrolase family 51 protein [Parathielavia hyrcaniae]|uniref:non-reducing end alpha-L-arabinofuranosidase n=1 Tax=Parathielavia hyrcaniae TaxID=113614 RepID=A0AAN6SX19_9PEZI|nr:glycoside hydrolase family 51 protein [Parathielavia hyrcaniae]